MVRDIVTNRVVNAIRQKIRQDDRDHSQQESMVMVAMMMIKRHFWSRDVKFGTSKVGWKNAAIMTTTMEMNWHRDEHGQTSLFRAQYLPQQ